VRRPLLLQSSRRLLRRPPLSARGLLRQPPMFPVPRPLREPPTGSLFPRPQHLLARRQVYQSNMVTTTTLRRHSNLSRVLTFNDAGLGQRSLSGRRLGLHLRGRSGLLSGRRGFFLRHRCSGFIPLPGQVRRFPAEYTSRLSIKYDHHIKYYSGRINTYKLDQTTVTVGAPRILAMSTSPASAGASSCACVAAASSAAGAAGSVLPRAAGV
jgi:hypothetical protein